MRKLLLTLAGASWLGVVLLALLAWSGLEAESAPLPPGAGMGVVIAVALLSSVSTALLFVFMPHASSEARGESGTATVTNMNRFMDGLARMLEGDLGAATPMPGGLSRRQVQEVGTTIETLREQLRAARRASSELAGTGSQMAQHLAAVEQAASSTLPVANQQVTALRRSVREVHGQVKAANDSLGEAGNQATHGVAAAKHGGESLGDAREHLEDGTSRLRRVRERNRAIGDAIGLVRDLAEQSNVLALNAAIQASRSGEDGLNVVADELQRVAARAAEAGQQIDEALKGAQEDLGEALGSVERCQTSFNGARQGNETSHRALEVLDRNCVALSKRLEPAVREAAAASETLQALERGLEQTLREVGTAARALAASTAVVSEVTPRAASQEPAA